MNARLLSVSVCVFLALSIQARAANIPGVFSTGVGSSGAPLAAGTVDPHWTLTSSPDGPLSPKVTSPYLWWWSGGTSSSAWINDSGLLGASPGGHYLYTLTFSLDGFDPQTAVITGKWVSDNDSTILLNGASTGFTHSLPWEYRNFDSFTLNTGFVAGLNTLTFDVYNTPPAVPNNPTGLQVQILSALAVVPEPGSLSLICLFGCMSLLWRGTRYGRR
jgi:hypothetical protein